MPKSRNYQVDPRSFILAIGEGITKVDCGRDATVFAQGDEADAVFYIQAGRVKITTV
jgi:CRP-like cAMP-binding protein